MKVYIVYSIPDYIGIDIEAIYDNEAAAALMVQEHNATVPSYERFDYFEQDVIHSDIIAAKL